MNGSKNNLYKNDIKKDPFAVEKMRDVLAKERKYKEFKKTYTAEYPEIKDINTPGLWNILNNKPQIDKQKDPMAHHRLQIVSNLVTYKRKKVLNVGCGSGDLEYVLKKNGKLKMKNWYGIDISNESVSKLKKEYPKSNFIVADIRKIRFKDEYFDTIVALEVFEHIKPREIYKVLKLINKKLKPDGNLIVSIPLNEDLEEMIRKGVNLNAHTRLYTEDILKTELYLTRFRVKWGKKLYAFNKNYVIKSFISKILPLFKKKPNNIILLAEKI